ncbi:helix-turn-helix transcriptional regulator [Streptomyces olivoreticuli]|uniref:helix-turn-helix transcriptional regulator n=1 Tax=Streptomyces olivoreticuli TaxID=68246 RepID=UPI000E272A34|nr:helix-turn-helix domain-containing protein [Streptomyces olivoreticuli]
MSWEELRALPPLVSVVTAARALGIGRTTAYRLIKEGTFPVRTLPLGGSTKVSTASLWDVLGA